MIESKLKTKNATVDSCFDLVGSRQHGVAAKNRTNSSKANCLLNAQYHINFTTF